MLMRRSRICIERTNSYPGSSLFFPCAVENCMSGEVALDHQPARYRPRSKAMLQLCFGRTRGLCIESEYQLSNRAEKRVEAPGPCCTLEFAVLSRPDGQQPK